MDMDPYEQSVRRFLRKAKSSRCKPALVQVDDDVLKVDQNLIRVWKYLGPNCCYRIITREQQNVQKYNKDADWSVSISKKCYPLPSTAEGFRVQVPFVKIECQNGLKVKTSVDFQAIVLHPEKHSNQTKAKAAHWTKENPQRPPSILIIGIDSISRMHMMRSLPKTREYLLQNDFAELLGYTKIGENTFPNMMGALAGLEANEYATCWPKRNSKLDNCPFIWRNFSELNYMTAHLEDAPGIAIFNYEKTGFVVQPADYYVRPLMVAQHKFLHKSRGSSNTQCMAGRTPTNFLCDYMKNFLGKVGREYPFFLLSWFTTIAHDDFNGLQVADDAFKSLLEESLKHKENTLILFISDHGYRFGEFRETFMGFYEESLPFFFIRMPDTLKSQFPEWYEALRRNRHRLTSPLDLHETIKDILTLAQLQTNASTELLANFYHRKQENLYKKAYSFFETVPTNRTCESSGIPQRYCMCGVTPVVSRASEISAHLGEVLVAEVNNILEPVIKSEDCVILKYSKFLYGREVNQGDVWNNFGQLIPYTDYLIAIETLPSKAHFEAKVRIFTNSTKTILGGVSRINAYAGQSDCIADYNLKNFCMCQNAMWKVDKKYPKPTKTTTKVNPTLTKKMPTFLIPTPTIKPGKNFSTRVL